MNAHYQSKMKKKPVSTTAIAKAVLETQAVQFIRQKFWNRWDNEPLFKWVVVGGTVYIFVRLTCFNILYFKSIKTLLQWGLNRFKLRKSLIIWTGEVEPELPFGRLGYTRCLEADSDVLEKFDIPTNVEKCLRDGIQYIPGEIYQKFDINEYDSKVTPLAWSYGPIVDPGMIMPIGWYNDMSGENQEYELFCRYLRSFGYLPPEAYSEIYQHCKILVLEANKYLIRIGDPDDKIFLVVHGAVDVYSNQVGLQGEFIRLRTALQGGNIVSLFSLLDAITGNSRPVQTVFAVSKLNTTKVLVIYMAAIKDYFMRNQEYLVSAIVRLLERGYRFQYQVMHLAMRLTTSMSTMDSEPLRERPTGIQIPEHGEQISDELRQNAIREFMKFLDIDDLDMLNELCQVIVVEPEEETTDIDTLKQSVLNQATTAYKFVYVGKLEEFHLKSNLTPMEQQARRKPKEEQIIPETLIHIVSGEGVGGLTGILRYYNVLFFRCVERSIIVTMDNNSVNLLLEKKPEAILPMVYMAVFRMSPLARTMDFSMEWCLAKEGQYIYHKEQMCCSCYLILSGRARAYQLDSETRQRAILEYKENDLIGLSESLLQSKRRSKTCVVIRDTEFIKIPNELVRNIVINYSTAAQVMLNFLIRRSLKTRSFELQKLHGSIGNFEPVRETRLITTIAIIPANELLPYSVLASEIKRHFISSGKEGERSCLILTYAKTLQAISKQEITVKDQFILEMHILPQLQKYDLVIFMCLPRMHYWNKVCSNHAEVMFSVGSSVIPNVSTIPQDFEKEIVGKKISSRRKELILLHTMDANLPSNTKEWLFCRDWLNFHHHIRLPKEAFQYSGDISEEELEREYASHLYRPITPCSDLSRFNRWITGKTFGAIFSCGGARIGAQLGMLQATVESRHIPIDMVCGTGSGFLLAMLYAVFQDYGKVQERLEKVFKDLNELSHMRWMDYTLPYINLGNGKRVLLYFYEMFGSTQLEDTWLPICCVTTNLTSQDCRVDRSGPAWVYLRANFSHIGNCPPMSDPIDGDYICDGAHANSLPQDIIKEFGAEYIIAFNTVGAKFSDETKADLNVSVLRFISKTFSAFLKQVGLASPSYDKVFRQLATTQTRMYATSVEALSSLECAIFVRPPTEHLPSQDWRNLPYLHRVGYFYMKCILDRNPFSEDIPFYVWWSQLRRIASELAKENLRDLSDLRK